MDVRVKRGADAASDHHLVVAKLKLKLKRWETISNKRTKYNTQLLQEKAYADAFQIALKNKYQARQALENIQEDSKNIKMGTRW